MVTLYHQVSFLTLLVVEVEVEQQVALVVVPAMFFLLIMVEMSV